MGQLYNDNPRGAPLLRTLGYGSAKKARASVRALRRFPCAYQAQAGTAMYYRAKHHAHQTADMRAAMKVYGKFLRNRTRKCKHGDKS
jgi:hypothetical protein